MPSSLYGPKCDAAEAMGTGYEKRTCMSENSHSRPLVADYLRQREPLEERASLDPCVVQILGEP